MKAVLRIGFLALAMMLALAVPVNAGPFEDGQAAYSRGDYATAMRMWRPGSPSVDEYYASTLFPQSEAQAGSCTSRSTIYTPLPGATGPESLVLIGEQPTIEETGLQPLLGVSQRLQRGALRLRQRLAHDLGRSRTIGAA